MENKHVFSFKAVLSELPDILDSLESLLNDATISDEDRNAILLSAEEAIVNIIHHAYTDSEKGTIQLYCHLGKEKCVLTILDKGKPFNPTTIPAPDLSADIASRKVGGLGIFLMQQFMDKVSYSFYKKTGNQLVMIKNLQKKNS